MLQFRNGTDLAGASIAWLVPSLTCRRKLWMRYPQNFLSSWGIMWETRIWKWFQSMNECTLPLTIFHFFL